MNISKSSQVRNISDSAEENGSCSDISNLSEHIRRGYFEEKCLNRPTSSPDEGRKHRKLSSEDWLAYEDLFGDALDEALSIVEGKDVLFYSLESCPSVGLYHVSTTTKTVYVLQTLKYCTCFNDDFQDKIRDGMVCVHIAACHIARATRRIHTIPFSSELLTCILESIPVVEHSVSLLPCDSQLSSSSSSLSPEVISSNPSPFETPSSTQE